MNRGITIGMMTILAGCASDPGGRQTTDVAIVDGEDPGTAQEGDEGQLISEEVTLTAAAGRQVFGTLTRPRDDERHPAVLLIAGSGPTDRDWQSPLLEGDNGSGRLLAEALTAAGFVCLRYDKLASGRSPAPELITWDEYESEQRAALALLVGHDAVNADRVFVLGHSMGGVHAQRLVGRLPAEERGRVPGVILLSSPARSMRDLIYAQLEEQFTAAGVEGIDLVAVLSPVGAAMDAIIAGLEPDLEAIHQPPVRQLVVALANPMSLPFARQALVFDPAAAVGSLAVPLFIAGADRDLQVPVASAEALAEAARGGGNQDVTLHVAQETDHVFKHEPTPRDEIDRASVVTRYNEAGRELEPRFVAALVEWLTSHSS